MLASIACWMTQAGCGADQVPKSAVVDKNAAPSAATAPASNSPAAATPASYPPAPRDESLTVDEYLKAGMPAHDRDWIGVDMQTLTGVLKNLTVNDRGLLPRYQSEKSGEIFRRMTNPGNLLAYRSSGGALAARMPLFLAHYESQSQLLKLYLTGFVEEKTSANELIELGGLGLRSSAMMCELLNEILPTLDKEDPSYPVRLQGLEKTRQSLALAVAGALTMLSDFEKVCPATDRKRLVGYLEESMPAIWPELPEASRKEMDIRLEAMSKDGRFQDLQPELGTVAAKSRTISNQIKPAAP